LFALLLSFSLYDAASTSFLPLAAVGYGDVFPVTSLGKLIASVAALCGILVIAIPITIIATNFNAEYAKMQQEKEKVKARMVLLKHHFKARKQGLDAVLDEVEDLVRRNAQEFASEVESLFERVRRGGRQCVRCGGALDGILRVPSALPVLIIFAPPPSFLRHFCAESIRIDRRAAGRCTHGL
jgi:hypothetical protein